MYSEKYGQKYNNRLIALLLVFIIGAIIHWKYVRYNHIRRFVALNSTNKSNNKSFAPTITMISD